MKKFYAFAAAALLATAANAQNLYIVGAGDGLDWTPETPAEFEMVDGQFVKEVTNLVQFKISTVMGDWDTFNTGVLGCAYGEEQGVPVALEEGWSSNIETPWVGDYKIVVSGDMKTITLTTDTPKPGDDVLPELYLRGDMNGWGAPAEWKLEALNKEVFTFVCAEDQQIAAGESFKIADANWGKFNYGAGEDPATMLDVETGVFQGSNTNLGVEETFNGVLWFNLNIDGEAYIILSNDKTYVPEWPNMASGVANVAVANEVPVYYNLQGVRVANPANGIYVKVVAGKATKAVIK